MPKLMQVILIILAVAAIAIADVFLKRAAGEANLFRALKSPWMAGAILLYLYQIVFVTYFFIVGWGLSLIGSLQAAFYALIVVLAGIFYFEETLSPTQLVGIILAFSGVILINSH